MHFDGAMKEPEKETYNGQDRPKRAVPTLARAEILASTGCRLQSPGLNHNCRGTETLEQMSEENLRSRRDLECKPSEKLVKN